MRKFYVQQGKLRETDRPDQADMILLSKSELDELERKLANKEDQVQRLQQKLTGSGKEFRLISIDYLDGRYTFYQGRQSKEPAKIYASIHLPVAHKLDVLEAVKDLVKTHLGQYLENRQYKLHFAPGAGWSVNLELYENELPTFQLPDVTV